MVKGGRPRKSEQERRADHLNIRLTVLERAALDAEARRLGMPISSYVRRLMLKRRSEDRPTMPSVTHAAVSALNRVGNNLNQLARHANARGDLALVAQHLDHLLIGLEAAIDALLDQDQKSR